MTEPKRIAVITGSRSDYGLLRPILRALEDDARFDLQLFVAAAHLQQEYGLTISEIDADGYPIAGRVDTGEVQRPEDLGRALGAGILGFTEAFRARRSELLLVLGDRHEALSAGLAATGLGLPVAHLHGGELSEGSIDDAQRHCLTKLAHVHFVAARSFGERVCQLGEQPDRVFVFGAPALEAIRDLPLLDRGDLSQALGGIDLWRPLVVLTLHPASLDPGDAEQHANAVLGGLDVALNGLGTVVVTLPGDDLGNVETRRALLQYADHRSNVHAFASLGQLRYLSLLSHADVVVGNSSSGILETPSFKVPTVNVGHRQRGRLRAPNVIDAESDPAAVADALTRALDPTYRARLADMQSPFGDGDTSRRVVEVLAGLDRRVRDKQFFDLPDGPWRSRLVLGSDQR